MLPLPLNLNRALDLTTTVAGAVASRTLADLGAAVVAVQVPDKGIGASAADDVAGMMRNKFSLALDTSHADARDLLLRLARACDIVLVDADESLIDYSTLAIENPYVIYVTISGDTPQAGLAAAAAVLSAIFVRRPRGVGQRIDVDADSVSSVLGTSSRPTDTSQVVELVASRDGIREQNGVPYRFSRSPAHVRLPAPAFGEHANAVLHDLLGLDPLDVEKLRASGLVLGGA